MVVHILKISEVRFVCGNTISNHRCTGTNQDKAEPQRTNSSGSNKQNLRVKS
jgi:hypothetical protein